MNGDDAVCLCIMAWMGQLREVSKGVCFVSCLAHSIGGSGRQCWQREQWGEGTHMRALQREALSAAASVSGKARSPLHTMLWVHTD